MQTLERIAGSLERISHSRSMNQRQYQQGMLLATTGIFMILFILLVALVMAATNQRPWEAQ